MKGIDQLVSERRSIRKYKKTSISNEQILELVEAASLAPSPSNIQPVRFIKISSEELRRQLFQEMEDSKEKLLEEVSYFEAPKRMRNLIKAYWRYSTFMFNAPVLLAVCSEFNEESFSQKLYGAGLVAEDLRGSEDLSVSVGISVQSFMLKAIERGLGTCVLSAPMNFLTQPEKILGIENLNLHLFLTLGYPDEEPGWIEKKKPEDIFMEL